MRFYSLSAKRAPPVGVLGVGIGRPTSGVEMFESLISAAGNLIGGFMNQNAQENANAQNQANWQTSMAYQDLVNKNTIQWKVADAKKAGIHPLAALGVNPAGGPASFIGATPETGMGDAVARAGQDISRAVTSTATQQKRAEAFDNSVKAMSVENMSLRNDLLRSQIARINQQSNPPVPSFDQRWQVDGQGDTARVKMQPFQVTPGEPGKPWMEPGAISDVGYSRTPGGYAVVPSKEMQERIEDNWLASMAWMYRNQVLPSAGGYFNRRDWESPPSTKAPDGYEWRWNAMRQEYRPARKVRKWGIDWKEWK